MEKNFRERCALAVVRIVFGVFFIFEGWDKLPWMTHPGQLADILRRWAAEGAPTSRWYIEMILLPGVSVFARLVFVGEVAAGLAFVFGVLVRPAAVVALLMVLNIHFAHSSILHYSFLSKGDGPPILAGLVALIIAGKNLPLSLAVLAGGSRGSRRK